MPIDSVARGLAVKALTNGAVGATGATGPAGASSIVSYTVPAAASQAAGAPIVLLTLPANSFSGFINVSIPLGGTVIRLTALVSWNASSGLSQSNLNFGGTTATVPGYGTLSVSGGSLVLSTSGSAFSVASGGTVQLMGFAF